jgi:hypothetical protein
MEEALVLTNTGQLVAAVVVKLQSGKHEPVMTIRVPGGLYLPAGLNLQIDDGKAAKMRREIASCCLWPSITSRMLSKRSNKFWWLEPALQAAGRLEWDVR